MKSAIEVLFNTGERVRVEGKAVGPFFIHQRPAGDNIHLDGYAVTHAVCGLRVPEVFDTEEEARSFAEALIAAAARRGLAWRFKKLPPGTARFKTYERIYRACRRKAERAA